MKSSIIKLALLPLVLIVNYATRKKPYHKVLYVASMAYLVGDIIFTISKLFTAKNEEESPAEEQTAEE